MCVPSRTYRYLTSFKDTDLQDAWVHALNRATGRSDDDAECVEEDSVGGGGGADDVDDGASMSTVSSADTESSRSGQHAATDGGIVAAQPVKQVRPVAPFSPTLRH